MDRGVSKPIRLGSVLLRNSLALAAMTRGMAQDDGCPTPEMAAYYRRFARNHVGLLITEATSVPGPASRTYLQQPGIAEPRQADAWRRVVDAVKLEGGCIFLQLQHGGPFREPELGPAVGPTDRVPAVPSWQRQRPYFQTRRMDREEVAAVVDAFAEAAGAARDAGFDGIEIHGSRGYLLDAFLSGSNDRDDEYGGSLENRLRLPTEVARAVRREVGTMPLSYNLSLYKMDTTEYQPPGGVDEMKRVVEALSAAGVDAFHVTTRGFERCHIGGLPLVDVVRGATAATVIGGGGVKTIQEADALLQQGRVDIVSMARVLLANPDILRRAAGSELQAYRRGMERLPVTEAVS